MPDDDPTTPAGPSLEKTGSTALTIDPAPVPVTGEGPAAGSTPVTSLGVIDPDVGRPAPRTRTMVLGLILLVIGGCVLISQVTDIELDPGTVTLGVMVAAGLLLIAGALRRTNEK